MLMVKYDNRYRITENWGFFGYLKILNFIDKNEEENFWYLKI